MRGPRRVVLVAAAPATQLERRPALACELAQRAMELLALVDGWLDEPASVRLAAARAFEAAGHAARSREIAAAGAAWILERAAPWTLPAGRQAWGSPATRRTANCSG